MINQVLAAGFDTIELGYDTTIDLVPDVKRMVSQGTIKVSSLHNFCPVPVGAPYGHPEIFPLTGLDSRSRQSAVTHTKRTIEFAAEIGARAVVVHAGNVDMKHMTRDLIDMCLQGQQYSPSYDKIKLKLMMHREKKVQEHLDQLYRSLDELIPFLTQNNIRMGIENLPSWEAIPCETEMEDIFRRFDSPFLGYWHDMGHGQIRQNLGFIGHKRWFERLSPKLVGMHIHDVRPPANDHIMPPAGKIIFQDFKSGIRSDTILVFEPAPGLPVAEVVEGKRIVAEAWDIPISK
ncbi:MAG: hypothetical protein A2283_09745 [Lentisphaerae bacterium RIFOXYA12_FULL_48_11]|nr:MAG: hypothetical protein A2283_09745 [Lentisphaerae bacterium RIFOXYA12_FULL_48_11]